MIGKSGRSVDALERTLRDRRSLREAKLREAEQSEKLAGESDARLDEIAAEVLAGRLTEDAAAKRFEELERSTGGHRRNAVLQARAVEQLQREIAELERTLAERPFEEAVAKLPAVGAEAVKASEDFARLVGSTLKAGRTLAKKRAALDEAITEAKRLCPQWRELAFEVPDEAPWPDGVKELVKLLQGGRRDEAEREVERIRRRDQEAKKAAERRAPHMADLIVTGGLSVAQLRERFDALTEEEQAETLRQAEASLVNVEAEIRAEFQHPDALPGQESREQARVERVREAIEQRIGWLREGKVPGPVEEPFEVFAGGRL
jgi:hypothetical protein